MRVEVCQLVNPANNAIVETFNGLLRRECLKVHWFESLERVEGISEV